MSIKNARFLPKRTAVPGRIPTGTTGDESNLIKQGEFAVNTADKKIFSYDGSNIFEYGTNSFLGLSGGTINGNFNVTGSSFFQTISATTMVSGSTNLYNIFQAIGPETPSTLIQNGLNTYTGGTIEFPTVNISSATLNSLSVSGNSNFNNITATTYYGNGSNLTGITSFVVKSGDTMSGDLTISTLSGTTLRTLHIDASGKLIIGDELDSLYISATTIISLLENNSNWNQTTYTGATLTGITDGQRYVNSGYTYEMLNSIMYRNSAILPSGDTFISANYYTNTQTDGFLNQKYDKSGGTISGSTIITNDLTVSSLTGTTIRTLHIDATGKLILGFELDSLYITGATIISLLENNSNWNQTTYTGATLTGITDGQRYINTGYTYEMLNSIMYRNSASLPSGDTFVSANYYTKTEVNNLIYKITATTITATTVIDTFSDDLAYGAVWNYAVKDETTNMRAGTFRGVWDSNTDIFGFDETSTADIGNTDAISFSGDISSNNVRLIATPLSGTWTVIMSRILI